ncbi:MAG: hypothetical protein ACRDQB_13620, partial [Thermocrispum sp.]
MSIAAELHVQPAVLREHGRRFAALFLEGESPGFADGAVMVARARGLPMITDPELTPLRPIRGWHVTVDPPGLVTVAWPHPTPLIAAAELNLPGGWLEAADEHRIVLLFAGQGLGLHEHAGGGQAHAGRLLDRIAADGALVAGAAAFGDGSPTLDGTLGHHRVIRIHRIGRLAGPASSPRWW